jgi:hypothetical protein
MLLCVSLKMYVKALLWMWCIKVSAREMCYVRFKGGEEFHVFFYTQRALVQRKMTDECDRCSAWRKWNKSVQNVDMTNVATWKRN